MPRFLIVLRSLVGVFFLFPIVTLVLCAAILLNVFTFNFQAFTNKIIDLWSRSACWIFGVELILKGQNNIPKGGCLYLFNHTSFFDIFVLYILDPSLRFGAKIELFSIPIFGYTMRKTGTLPIPRSNIQEAIRVYENATERAKLGQRFALSPEGGRGEGRTLNSFKSGPFVFALKCNIDLSPVIIRGAEAAWPKGALIPATTAWKSRIEVEVLPRIEVKSFTLDRRNELKDLAFQKMNERLASDASMD